jgi:hypothetical protein
LQQIFVIALEALFKEREGEKLFNNPSQISLNHDYFCQKRKKQTEIEFFCILPRLLEHVSQVVNNNSNNNDDNFENIFFSEE